MGKVIIGVVISNDNYDGGLAPLQWAQNSLNLGAISKLYILPVNVNSKDQTNIADRKLRGNELKSVMWSEIGEEKDNIINKFDELTKQFQKACTPEKPKESQKEPPQSGVEVRMCTGANIQEILKEAIKKLQLDTLVVGSAAVGSIPSKDLKHKNSECSVVVVAEGDPESQKTATTSENSAKKSLEKKGKKTTGSNAKQPL